MNHDAHIAKQCYAYRDERLSQDWWIMMHMKINISVKD